MKGLCQKMESKTNISMRLKQFDGLTWLAVTPLPPTYFVTEFAGLSGAITDILAQIKRTDGYTANFEKDVGWW